MTAAASVMSVSNVGVMALLPKMFLARGRQTAQEKL
jgi:hypothetical protein